MTNLVLEHYRANAETPEGEKRKYTVLVFGLGGGMRGPYGAGQVAGLNEVGLTADKANVLAGISAGAADLAYYAGGRDQTLKGSAIYYHQCAGSDFLNLLRLNHVMDATIVGDAMREGKQALDTNAVREGPEFYAGVTPKDNPHAKTEFIDVKDSKQGIVAPIEASINVPILFAPGISVNSGGGMSIQYIDGAFSSIPIDELIEKFHPTDILVLPNVPFQRVEDFVPASDWVEKLPRAGSIGTIRKFLQVSSELRKMLDFFQKEKGVNIGMLWPPDRGLGTLKNDPDIVQLGIYDTIRDTIKQCGGDADKPIEMYLPEKDKYLEISK